MPALRFSLCLGGKLLETPSMGGGGGGRGASFQWNGPTRLRSQASRNLSNLP